MATPVPPPSPRHLRLLRLLLSGLVLGAALRGAAGGRQDVAACPGSLDCALKRRARCSPGARVCGPCLLPFREDHQGLCVPRTRQPPGAGDSPAQPRLEDEIDFLAQELARQEARHWRLTVRPLEPAATLGLAERHQGSHLGLPSTRGAPAPTPRTSLGAPVSSGPVHMAPLEPQGGHGDGLALVLAVACSVAGAAALVVAALCWCRLQRDIRLTQKADYAAPRVPSCPATPRISPGDQKLAHSAEVYHYQHHRQQMRCLERHKEAPKGLNSASSDEENEDGDFTVYECPGLAPLLRRAPGGAPVPRPTLVLVWHWPFADRPPELPSNTCASYGVAHCHLSTNRSLLASADVVVFHHRELQTRQARLPLAERPRGQPWVWASMESPSHTHGLSLLRGIFNWVLSYRRDSDIFVPYGCLEPRDGPAPPLPAKTRVAAWVVSNFQERQPRVRLYRQLAPHLRVDVFGRAHRRPLCAHCLLPTVAQYLFYLSFENSQHRDYITEKFWRNALWAGAVPVVLGPPRADYEALVPPDAFVHVDDFGSARELAAFLAGMNESCYRGYFAWQERFRVRLFSDWRERFCAICTHYPHLPRDQVYHDLEGWFQA